MPSTRAEPPSPASYSVAFGTVLYAVLFAISIPFLLWGVTRLLSYSPYSTTIFDLVEIFLLLAFGSVLLFFSVGGALAVVLRDVRAESDAPGAPANAGTASDA